MYTQLEPASLFIQVPQLYFFVFQCYIISRLELKRCFPLQNCVHKIKYIVLCTVDRGLELTLSSTK